MSAETMADELVHRAIGALDGMTEAFQEERPDSKAPVEDLHREWTYFAIFSLDAAMARVEMATKNPSAISQIRKACMDIWASLMSGRVPLDEGEINDRLSEYREVLNKFGPEGRFNMAKAVVAHIPGNPSDVGFATPALSHAITTLVFEAMTEG